MGDVSSKTSLMKTDDIAGDHYIGVATGATLVETEVLAGFGEGGLRTLVKDLCHAGS